MNDSPLWQDLADEFLPTVAGLLRNRSYHLAFGRYGDRIGLNEEEFMQWAKWLVQQYPEEMTPLFRRGRNAPEPPPEPQPEPENLKYEMDKAYWFDGDRDIYMVSLPSKKKPLAIPGETWRAIIEAYSNWDGAPASVNEMTRKFGMARRTMVELLRAMGTTHDSSPWTDEDLLETDAADLTEDLLRRKEEKVLVTAERREWNKIKKDAHAFRRLDLLATRLGQRFEENSTEYLPRHLSIKEAKEPWSAVVSPTDFHWGSYAPEYGGDPYNRTIAKQRLFEHSEALISRLASRGRPECIYLALGGDGLHIDSQTKTTTHGTPQDCDGSPEELAWTWVMLCRDYVDYMRQLCPVKLFCIPGNHDRYTTTLLRAAMAGWFSQSSDVEVVESLTSRQYASYGRSLLCFLHGDIGKVKDWPAIIAGEVPDMWGISKSRFVFTGHLHTERELPTFGDVVVYRMPSLAGTDSWHHSHGYKSRKALIAYIVDKDRGVIAQEIEPCG